MKSKILDIQGKQLQETSFSAYRCYPDITETQKAYVIDEIRHNHDNHMIMTYNVNGSGYRAQKIYDAIVAVEKTVKACPTVILIQELK